MLPKILSTQIALPPHKKSLAESLPYVEHWIQDLPERQQKKILRIFKYAMVENRYSIRDVNEMFNGDSFQQRNDYYIKHAIDLATEVIPAATWMPLLPPLLQQETSDKSLHFDPMQKSRDPQQHQ